MNIKANRELYLKSGDDVRNSIWAQLGRKERIQMKIKNELLKPLSKEFPNGSYYPVEDGWTNVEIEVDGLEAITNWVLQQSNNVEVLTPLNFRLLIIDKIKKTYEIYAVK